jgi:integrase
MPRQLDPIFCRDGVYYARWYENKRRVLLSLGTADRVEANRRLPIVRSTNMSWEEFQRTTAGYGQNPPSLISGLGNYSINPPLSIRGTREGVKTLLETAISEGTAKYNSETGEWVIVINSAPEVNADLAGGLQEIKRLIQGTNDTEQIQQFYKESVLQLYTDKKTASRNAKIWLAFLQKNNITSWVEVTEKLCADFRDWRKATPQARNNQAGKPPSTLVVNRHIAFISKSFELALHRGFMKINPIKFWRPDSYQAPQKQGLSRKELKKVLNDSVWQHEYLMNGKIKVPLGYKLQDILLLLFASCKRRGEIIGLGITDVSFLDRFVSYLETKNSSKGVKYSIRKSFFISDFIEKILRKIIKNKKEGPVFYVPDVLKRDKVSSDIGYFNADYFSQLFKECVEKYAPDKDISLNCLRHTATNIMEEEGMTDAEIDDTLGHYNVKTALKNYQDRSARVLAIRLANRTKKGIEILSGVAEKLLE